MRFLLIVLAMLSLVSVAEATNPRSRGNCPQDRGFSRDFGHSHQQRDFRDFDPREVTTTTEIRRGAFGRVRRSETTRTVR
ncbi:MAG: hypothetical protein E6R03_16595 [Hyphomicrobiaceae bacterium]|nr:MAG: hypothetical protein E6R03_16595 [Hyphomicrobiaceae bacterium]